MFNSPIYDSPIASISKTESGIYLFDLKDTYDTYDEKEAKKQFDFFYAHSIGKAFKVYVDTSKSVNLPTEKAILYFNKHNRPEYKFAVMALNLPIKIFIGQLLKYKGLKNMKLFNTYETAMEWLLQKQV